MPLEDRGQVTRLVLHMRGSEKGTVTTIPLSPRGKATDFPTMNKADYERKKYCIYYANEWFHAVTYASMAVVKHNICTGERRHWYKPANYPSEPKFVDDDSSTIEDYGVIIFTVLDGTTNTSRIVMLNARSMEELESWEIEQKIAFTTHGEFYTGNTPGLGA